MSKNPLYIIGNLCIDEDNEIYSRLLTAELFKMNPKLKFNLNSSFATKYREIKAQSSLSWFSNTL